METQKQIKETLEKLVALEKVQNHYNSTIKELDNAYSKLDELHNVLEKQYNDVKEIEGLSMKSLFAKVLGSKEKQIEKERQEYLQASLKYNDFKKQVEVLEFERNLLKKKIIDIKLFKNKLETLKKKREKELLLSNSDQGKELMKIVYKIDEFIRYKKEITEAIVAGNTSNQELNKLVTYLKKAKDWGSWDMASSNSRHSSYYKRGSIDNAQKAAQQAQRQLNRFQNELYDIGVRNQEFEINIGTFNSFIDIFFDNLISDWVIQQKIKNALGNVELTKDKVTRLTRDLENKLSHIKGDILDLEKAKDQLLIK